MLQRLAKDNEDLTCRDVKVIKVLSLILTFSKNIYLQNCIIEV